MLTISQVSKAFAGRILFEDASLQVNRGDRVGLVGPNGAGKSTRFSLILGEASPDEGRISLEKSATIGFLPQEHAPAGEDAGPPRSTLHPRADSNNDRGWDRPPSPRDAIT